MSYYETERWQEIRQWVLEYWDGVCDHCMEEITVPHVHHRFGLGRDTLLSHFEVLCPSCHAIHHNNPEIEDFGYEDEDEYEYEDEDEYEYEDVYEDGYENWKKKEKVYYCKFCNDEIEWLDDPEFGWLPIDLETKDKHICPKIVIKPKKLQKPKNKLKKWLNE